MAIRIRVIEGTNAHVISCDVRSCTANIEESLAPTRDVAGLAAGMNASTTHVLVELAKSRGWHVQYLWAGSHHHSCPDCAKSFGAMRTFIDDMQYGKGMRRG